MRAAFWVGVLTAIVAFLHLLSLRIQVARLREQVVRTELPA